MSSDLIIKTKCLTSDSPLKSLLGRKGLTKSTTKYPVPSSAVEQITPYIADRSLWACEREKEREEESRREKEELKIQ